MSLEFLTRRHREYKTEFNLFFQRKNDYKGNGFEFPCDKDGNPILTDESQESYEFVKNNDDFCDGKVIEETYSWIEDAKVKCKCGNIFYLSDEFYGCGECPRCHQWYNLFGQEVISPEEQMELEEW